MGYKPNSVARTLRTSRSYVLGFITDEIATSPHAGRVLVGAQEAARKLGVNGSWDFAYALMQRAHLAVTPGRDFGQAETAQYVRFSTANSMPQLQEAVQRLRALLG